MCKKMTNREKTRLRLATIGRTLTVFEDLNNCGCQDLKSITTLFKINFPESNKESIKHPLEMLWYFRGYDLNILSKLEQIVIKLKK